MADPAEKVVSMLELDPRKAAARLAEAGKNERRWLDEFAENLDRYRASQSLAYTLGVWGLDRSHAAELFGVSRQALSKWLNRGVPSDRAPAVADLAAASDLLVHYLKRDRIPAVVRRKAAELGNRSLVDLLGRGDTATVLDACRRMFRFDSAQS